MSLQSGDKHSDWIDNGGYADTNQDCSQIFSTLSCMGFPCFVLAVKLQEENKRPKWNCHSRLGQFLCFFENHYYLAANVQNLTTGYISCPYHAVIDDFSEYFWN